MTTRDGHPTSCRREPTVFAVLRFRHPPPDGTTDTGFLCDEHRGVEQAVQTRPLGDRDRAELARRRAEQAHWDRVLAESRADAGWHR